MLYYIFFIIAFIIKEADDIYILQFFYYKMTEVI